MKACLKNGEVHRFERYFWTLVKSAFARMSTNPAQKDVVPGDDAGPMAVVFEEYSEEWADDDSGGRRRTSAFLTVQPRGTVPEPTGVEGILRRRRIRAVLAVMTPRQREVWSLLLDGRDIQEVRHILGGSRQNVEKLRETGLAKVRQRAKGGLVL